MSINGFFGRKKNSGSKAAAKDRLRLVLVSDRAGCSPEIMAQMKNEIIHVISKYIEIDMNSLDIKITQNEADGKNSLFANIPILDVKQKN